MTAPVAPRAHAAIGRGLLTSVLLHAAALGTVVAVVHAAPRVVPRPVYRVALVAAPPARGPAGFPAATPARATAARTPATAAPPATEVTKAAAVTVPATAKSPTKVPAPTHATSQPAVVVKPAAHSATLASPKPVLRPVLKPVLKPAADVPIKSAAKLARSAGPPPRSSRSTAKETSPTPTPTAARAATAAATAPTRPTLTTAAPGAGGDKPTAVKAARATSAGGSPVARGHDPADVRVVGLAFPYPGYLDNLVRQVRLRFSPTQTRTPLHADLAFVIARDGSVDAIRVVRGSGNYGFDLEAQGAIEAAGEARAFGPLPDGFHGTSLPVTFSFDPRSSP